MVTGLDSRPPSSARPGTAALSVCLGIVVAAGLLVFAQVGGFAFVTSDDTSLIAGNPHVTAWWHSTLRDRMLTPEFGYAIPVTVASFALDWALWSGSPAAFHLVNLGLHLACSVLVFLVLARRVRPVAALAAALLFTVHPVQAETVAFVTQRKDLLATLLALLALDRLLRALPDRPRWRDVAEITVLVLASALSKPAGAFVGMILAAIWVLHRPGDAAHRPWLVMAALSAVVCAGVTWLDLRIANATHLAVSEGGIPFSLRVGLVGSTLHHYLQVLVLPFDLDPKVTRPVVPDWVAVGLVAALFALALGSLLHALRRRNTHTLVVLAWVLGTYLPVSNVLPIQRHAADSLMYLPTVGLALGLGFSLDTLLGWRGHRAVVALVAGTIALWLTGLAVVCRMQASVWRDEETLFGYLYRLHPTQLEAAREYADLLGRTGRTEASDRLWLDYYARALRANPGKMAARHHLMRFLLRRGSVAEARRLLDGTPQSTQGSMAYLEARLEWAMTVHDWPAALTAVEAIMRMDPDSPRRALIPELEARTRPGVAGSAGY
jgi:hypothetical protein